MTTATTQSTSFLDGACIRIIAAIFFVAAVGLMVHLNRAELFPDQKEQKVAGMFPAYTSCRDGEYDKLAKMAADAPEKWTPEVMIRAKQAANAMCIRKTATQSGVN